MLESQHILSNVLSTTKHSSPYKEMVKLKLLKNLGVLTEVGSFYTEGYNHSNTEERQTRKIIHLNFKAVAGILLLTKRQYNLI